MLRLRRFIGDQRGGTAILFAVSATVLFGFGAMAVDVGNFFYEKRKLQTANDLAALAAASDLPRAQAAAGASTVQNGFPSDTIQALQTGVYTPDPNLAPGARFAPSSAAVANAVRIDMRTTTPLLLGRVLASSSASAPAPGAVPRAAGSTPAMASLSSGDVPIGSSAIAFQDAQASFAVGSRLLKLDGGLLNSLLGGLLGGGVSLSVMDYDALVKARVDLFDFSKHLATRLNLTAATYDDVLKADARLGDVLAAIVDASRDHDTRSSTATAALGRIASASASNLPVNRLAHLLRAGRRQAALRSEAARGLAVGARYRLGGRPDRQRQSPDRCRAQSECAGGGGGLAQARHRRTTGRHQPDPGRASRIERPHSADAAPADGRSRRLGRSLACPGAALS